jgi:hypothetical protein
LENLTFEIHLPFKIVSHRQCGLNLHFYQRHGIKQMLSNWQLNPCVLCLARYYLITLVKSTV